MGFTERAAAHNAAIVAFAEEIFAAPRASVAASKRTWFKQGAVRPGRAGGVMDLRGNASVAIYYNGYSIGIVNDLWRKCSLISRINCVT
jgi:hypothetical protein